MSSDKWKKSESTYDLVSIASVVGNMPFDYYKMMVYFFGVVFSWSLKRKVLSLRKVLDEERSRVVGRD